MYPKTIFNLIAANLYVEPELCEYDADSGDEQWLNTDVARANSVTKEDLETIIDRLKLTNL